jgi:hypothetical protein
MVNSIYKFYKDIENAQKIYGGIIKKEDGWIILENDKFKRPKEKLWRGIKVDVEIPISILQRINSNRNIKIIGTCSGHTFPNSGTGVYKGNFPEIHMTYNGNKIYILNTLRKIPHFKVEYSGISDRGEKAYSLFGNSKATNSWWNKAAIIIENI